MSDDKKDFGTGTFLESGNRSWETVIFQQGKPVSHAELNLIQDLSSKERAKALRRLLPSGFLNSDVFEDSYSNLEFGTDPNEFKLIGKPEVNVNGWLIPLEYTGTVEEGENVITLPPPPDLNERETEIDFIYLEVWRSLIEADSSTDNKPAADKIYPQGNILAPSATWVDDDLLNTPIYAQTTSETTRRVQIQYAIRTQRLGDLSNRDGYSDVNVEAQGPNGAPVATFNFVSHNNDSGLWIAGDGEPTNALNTIDGHIYSIPIALVYRRNDQGWDKTTNGNGSIVGVGTATESDRPDNLYADEVILSDFFDLRRSVASNNSEQWKRVAEKNMALLMDNTLRSWTMGSDQSATWKVGNSATYPSIGSQYLKCDVIAPDEANADSFGNWFRHADGITTIFSDRSHLQIDVEEFETIVDWVEDDTLTINLPSIEFISTSNPANDSEAYVTDILSVRLNDNNGATSMPEIPVKEITGLGTDEVTIILDTPLFASSENIWVEYEVTYLAGGGLTSLVSEDASNFNVIVENDTGMTGYEDVFITYEDGPHREVKAQWIPSTDRVLNTKITENGLEVILPEPPFVEDPNTPNDSFTVTIGGNPATVTGVEEPTLQERWWKLTLDAGSSGDSVKVTFTPLKPLPSTAQILLYYLAPAVQAIPFEKLEANLEIESLFIPDYMYTGTMSSGSASTPFPYEAPLNQIPVSGEISDAIYQREQELSAPGPVSIDSFDSNAGMLKLPTLVPLADVSKIVLKDPQDTSAKNLEFADHYADIEFGVGHRPSTFSQSLSIPVSHKTFLPILGRLRSGTDFGRKGDVVLLVLTQYFDQSVASAEENKISFGENEDYVAVGLYRVKGNWTTHTI